MSAGWFICSPIFLPDDKVSVRRRPAQNQDHSGLSLSTDSASLVDWLVNALAGLTDQSFELWIVGAGAEEPALRTLAARKLDNRVRWLGQLSPPEVPVVMAQADCVVLPSA
ncbi:MAG: glycosyltransferase family 4 protein [Betaproteobacteria bacterium]|nr:glycosyltransferase family 4 protein [Betaproteobacteria bacterium]